MRTLNFAVIFSFIVFVACSSIRTTIPVYLYKPLPNETPVLTDMRFDLDLPHAGSIKLKFKGDDTEYEVSNMEVLHELEILVRNSTYDALWNDGGIMVKVVEPDYTMIFSYIKEYGPDNEFLFVWRDTNKIKFKGVWYVLEDGVTSKVYELLESLK
ncbi:MAG: hypothetical protein LIO79_06415 [Rikenellaceae bacterium]|nr:hypothetical protein [Rikenellaceae bacterium]